MGRIGTHGIHYIVHVNLDRSVNHGSSTSYNGNGHATSWEPGGELTALSLISSVWRYWRTFWSTHSAGVKHAAIWSCKPVPSDAAWWNVFRWGKKISNALHFLFLTSPPSTVSAIQNKIASRFISALQIIAASNESRVNRMSHNYIHWYTY